MHVKVLAIIVGYFSSEYLSSLLPQLASQCGPQPVSMSIICIDNSASPEEASALRAIVAQSTVPTDLIFNTTNVGFGKAINIASREQEFDFLWLINPDVSLSDNTLIELLENAQRSPSDGIWGGVTTNKENTPDLRHAWKDPGLLNTFGWAFGINRIYAHPLLEDNYKIQLDDPLLPYPVDTVSGSCLLINDKAWNLTKGFDEDFFLYSEEVDLCIRARKLGFQPHVVPTSKLKHETHSKEVSRQRLTIIFSAKILLVKKHHGSTYTLIYRSLLATGALFRSIVYATQKRTSDAKAWKSVFWLMLSRSN